MRKLSVLKTASLFAALTFIGHLSIRAWIWIHPESYEWLLNAFVAGLQINVTDFDLDPTVLVVGTLLETLSAFLAGAILAIALNYLFNYRGDSVLETDK